MNSLKSVLQTLCASKYVNGAIIITKDGMVIESKIDNEFDSETVGAFMSQVAITIKNYLGALGYDEFQRYILLSDRHKIYLVDLGRSVLVSLTDRESDPGAVNVALFQAANEIKKNERLDV